MKTVELQTTQTRHNLRILDRKNVCSTGLYPGILGKDH